MKNKIRKICGGCKALEINKYGAGCAIGHPVKWGMYHGVKDVIPTEPCPKPLTIRSLVEIKLNP